MTAGEVLAAIGWHNAEAHRPEQKAAPYKAIAQAIHDGRTDDIAHLTPKNYRAGGDALHGDPNGALAVARVPEDPRHEVEDLNDAAGPLAGQSGRGGGSAWAAAQPASGKASIEMNPAGDGPGQAQHVGSAAASVQRFTVKGALW